MSDGGNLPSEFAVVNSTEPIPWRGFRAFDKVVFITLPLMAIAIAILPLLDPLLFRRAARLIGGKPFVAWLASGGAWIIAVGLLAGLLVYVLWRRHGLVSQKALWVDSGCPECGERELVRVSRHFGDRFYNLAAVPAYRYACRNCTWRGLRIARRDHSVNREEELEAALLRFDPDARAAEGDAAVTLAEAPNGPRRADADFHDAGDVDWDEPDAAPAYANGTDSHPTNHESDEPADDLDWLWRRSSGTDQI